MMKSTNLKVLAFTLTVTLLASCTTEKADPLERYSFRALSTPGNDVVWCAAQHGFWARSQDAGQTWDTGHVPAFNGSFRDVHAWNENEAVLMSIESPGMIFKTIDGGKTWEEVFRYEHPKCFFDQMDFNEKGDGIIVGDPIDGKWTILGSNNKGSDWLLWDGSRSWDALEGEVSFAASGSALSVDNDHFIFFSGGYGIKMYDSRKPSAITLASDTSSTFGVYSFARISDSSFCIVGGDYRFEGIRRRTAAVVTIKADQAVEIDWASTPPMGYRSCVVRLADGRLIATGPNGTDISSDGLEWSRLSEEGFHTLSVEKGNRILAAGSEGRIFDFTPLLP